MEADLTRERGLWGPPSSSQLDKWALDMVEGKTLRCYSSRNLQSIQSLQGYLEELEIFSHRCTPRQCSQIQTFKEVGPSHSGHKSPVTCHKRVLD